MKTNAGKSTLNILKIKLLKISGCRIKKSPIQINIRFCHCNYGNVAWGSKIETNLKKNIPSTVTCFPNCI